MRYDWLRAALWLVIPLAGVVAPAHVVGGLVATDAPASPSAEGAVAAGELLADPDRAQWQDVVLAGPAAEVELAPLADLPAPAEAPAEPAVLVGAGDIAACASPGSEATAALLDGIPGTVFTTGDNAYGDGTAVEFAHCYEPTWGRHRARTRPSPGNHDYGTARAAGYHDYFGAAAGEPDRAYYSYDLGAWHVIALNSNCAQVGGCHAGSPQEQWLRADLAANWTACTVAYWHHPRFSSGPHGGARELWPLWQALYDAGADVVLAGHDHLYERFAPQDPAGRADPARGIRQFTVGTGGASHYGVSQIAPNSEVRNGDTFGVLKLTLHPTGYEWEFVPVAGRTFTDSGSAACH